MSAADAPPPSYEDAASLPVVAPHNVPPFAGTHGGGVSGARPRDDSQQGTPRSREDNNSSGPPSFTSSSEVEIDDFEGDEPDQVADDAPATLMTLPTELLAPAATVEGAKWFKNYVPLCTWFTRDELVTFGRTFGGYDRTNSGYVKGAEVFSIYQQLGSSFTRRQVTALVDSLSGASTKGISFSDYVHSLMIIPYEFRYEGVLKTPGTLRSKKYYGITRDYQLYLYPFKNNAQESMEGTPEVIPVYAVRQSAKEPKSFKLTHKQFRSLTDAEVGLTLPSLSSSSASPAPSSTGAPLASSSPASAPSSHGPGGSSPSPAANLTQMGGGGAKGQQGSPSRGPVTGNSSGSGGSSGLASASGTSGSSGGINNPTSVSNSGGGSGVSAGPPRVALLVATGNHVDRTFVAKDEEAAYLFVRALGLCIQRRPSAADLAAHLPDERAEERVEGDSDDNSQG